MDLISRASSLLVKCGCRARIVSRPSSIYIIFFSLLGWFLCEPKPSLRYLPTDANRMVHTHIESITGHSWVVQFVCFRFCPERGCEPQRLATFHPKMRYRCGAQFKMTQRPMSIFAAATSLREHVLAAQHTDGPDLNSIIIFCPS